LGKSSGINIIGDNVKKFRKKDLLETVLQEKPIFLAP
jgi:hypothetical protein